MKLNYSPEAVADLKRLRDFIAEHNPDAAGRVAQLLLKSINQLCQFPKLGKPVEKAPNPENIRDLITGDYTVRYLLLEADVYNLRVWHQREDK